jgi:hypothetical protein
MTTYWYYIMMVLTTLNPTRRCLLQHFCTWMCPAAVAPLWTCNQRAQTLQPLPVNVGLCMKWCRKRCVVGSSLGMCAPVIHLITAALALLQACNTYPQGIWPFYCCQQPRSQGSDFWASSTVTTGCIGLPDQRQILTTQQACFPYSVHCTVLFTQVNCTTLGLPDQQCASNSNSDVRHEIQQHHGHKATLFLLSK